jgi:AbiTii-like protein
LGLLQEIEDAAASQTTPLADLLRRCAILAARLGHVPFKEWVAHELNGYPDAGVLPEYRRGVGGRLMAQVSGPFGSGANNVAVPLSQIPEEFRRRFTVFDFVHGAAELESMVSRARDVDKGRLRFSVPPELFALVEIYEGYSTVSMWSEVSIHSVVAILDQVRTRALMFALEIEAENPDAGELATSAPGQVSQDRVAQIFNTVILGGMVNLAAGSPGTSQQLQVAVVPGDFASLVEWLRLTGVPEDELAELSGAMDKDQATETKSVGQRTKDWIAKAAGKVAGAGGRITESAARELLVEAIRIYLRGS